MLGNPHYHQSHDTLETINHQLIAEVAKTTAATLMLLASSPSRIAGLEADGYPNGAAVDVDAEPREGRHRLRRRVGAGRQSRRAQLRVTQPKATLPALRPGRRRPVKAINARGWKAGTGRGR